MIKPLSPLKLDAIGCKLKTPVNHEEASYPPAFIDSSNKKVNEKREEVVAMINKALGYIVKISNHEKFDATYQKLIELKVKLIECVFYPDLLKVAKQVQKFLNQLPIMPSSDDEDSIALKKNLTT